MMRGTEANVPDISQSAIGSPMREHKKSIDQRAKTFSGQKKALLWCKLVNSSTRPSQERTEAAYGRESEGKT
jgi:hypothetical protein